MHCRGRGREDYAEEGCSRYREGDAVEREMRGRAKGKGREKRGRRQDKSRDRGILGKNGEKGIQGKNGESWMPE
jgi:hypothetical protein